MELPSAPSSISRQWGDPSTEEARTAQREWVSAMALTAQITDEWVSTGVEAVPALGLSMRKANDRRLPAAVPSGTVASRREHSKIVVIPRIPRGESPEAAAELWRAVFESPAVVAELGEELFAADSGVLAYVLAPGLPSSDRLAYVVVGPYWSIRAELGALDPALVVAGSHPDMATPLRPVPVDGDLRDEMARMAGTHLAGIESALGAQEGRLTAINNTLEELAAAAGASVASATAAARVQGLSNPIAFAELVDRSSPAELSALERQLNSIRVLGSSAGTANIRGDAYALYRELIRSKRYGSVPRGGIIRARPTVRFAPRVVGFVVAGS